VKAKPSIVVGLLAVTLDPVAYAAGGPITGEKGQLNPIAIGMFFVFIAISLVITRWASRRSHSTSDFYTAGGGITGVQNGLAIAGDYMSAATLLGLSSLIFAKGFDGVVYSLGFFVGWPLILFLMAERLRNLGRFTFADIIAYRLDENRTRAFAAFGSLVVVCLYLIAQMVGAGQLIELLFGLDYRFAVVLVGIMMMLYVAFGGMMATTWVQIIKAGLLLCAGTWLAFLVLRYFDFNISLVLSSAVNVHREKDAILAPGSLLADPVSTLSLSIGLMCGTAGLPHILMRFFTVKDTRQARKSVVYATGFIGYFFLIIALFGFASISIVGASPEYYKGGKIGGSLIGGSNMVAMHLSSALGGSWFLGFFSAVAFATILAVVSGLALAGASSISHDIFARLIKRGHTSEKDEIRVMRIATVLLCLLSVALGIIFRGQNVTFLVGLAFGVAASSNFPVLILSMYWRSLTSLGALVGGTVGLVSAVALVIMSPSVWVQVLGNAHPLFPYDQPAIFSMPLAFIVIVVVSMLDRSRQADRERELFDEQTVQAVLGINPKRG
jgi:cation/acetate symporter